MSFDPIVSVPQEYSKIKRISNTQEKKWKAMSNLKSNILKFIKLFMSPTSNRIAGFGSCVSGLILSETMYIVLSSGI